MSNKFKNFFDKEIRAKYLVSILALLCISSILFFCMLIKVGEKTEKKQFVKNTAFDAFQEINLTAQSAIVWDVLNQRELFSKNPDKPLPLASLTKILTAIVTKEKINDNQKIIITKEYLKPEGDSGLVVDDIWQARELRDFTLLTSSNDGAFALATLIGSKNSNTNPEVQFVKYMNDTATKIGLVNSRFFNEHGLDKKEDMSGAYGSARDMTILFEHTLKNYPEILEVTRYKKLDFVSNEKTYSATNTNNYVDQIPGIIASKTGYTDLAGGNLIIAFDVGLGHPVIISVLGSTEEGRFTDVLQLIDATLKQIPNL
ncbi:MAG: D-alanyl-D-alanine carboxypeptidase [Candidatus Zambryskibacteria bacterium]|nr:D-alanyl-D-alanine carboxypeptidase [Candidatus Zambryskibacteria bacterium]